MRFRPLRGMAARAEIALAWRREDPSPLVAVFVQVARTGREALRRAGAGRGSLG